LEKEEERSLNFRIEEDEYDIALRNHKIASSHHSNDSRLKASLFSSKRATKNTTSVMTIDSVAVKKRANLGCSASPYTPSAKKPDSSQSQSARHLRSKTLTRSVKRIDRSPNNEEHKITSSRGRSINPSTKRNTCETADFESVARSSSEREKMLVDQ